MVPGRTRGAMIGRSTSVKQPVSMGRMRSTSVKQPVSLGRTRGARQDNSEIVKTSKQPVFQFIISECAAVVVVCMCVCVLSFVLFCDILERERER